MSEVCPSCHGTRMVGKVGCATCAGLVPPLTSDDLRRQLDECHRQHESVIERLDDAKAQVEVLRLKMEAAEQRLAAAEAERDAARADLSELLSAINSQMGFGVKSMEERLSYIVVAAGKVAPKPAAATNAGGGKA